MSVLTESITGIGSAPTLVETGNSPVAEPSGASWVWPVTLMGGVLLAAGGFRAVRLAKLRSR